MNRVGRGCLMKALKAPWGNDLQFLARSESGADGHIWKEIMKTIHVDAGKHRKEIREAYVVLSGSSKVLRDYVLRQLCADSILLNATKKFTKEAVAFN
ncbi:hypothetical protein Tco_1350168 [Tanacetum coccineum]